MSEEELLFLCPCCSAELTCDEAGQLIPTGRIRGKGINGIQVTTAGGDDWRTEQYRAREPQKYQVPAQMVDLVQASEPIQPDEKLMDANRNDLKKRNLNYDQS